MVFNNLDILNKYKDDSMKAHDLWLKPSASLPKKLKIKLLLWLLIQKTVFKFSPSKLFRIWLLNAFGANVKNDCFISSSALIYMPWNLVMGNRSSIDFDTLVYSLDKVILGDFVSIAYNVNINTGSHDFTDVHLALLTAPIVIESGVFIGADSYIAPGVNIGCMSVIGARSNVFHDMPEDHICFGSPCRPIKKRVKKNIK